MINLFSENFKIKIESFAIFLFTLIPLLYIVGNAILDICIVVISLSILFLKLKEIINNKNFILVISYFLLISFVSFDIDIVISNVILIRFILLFSFIILLVEHKDTLHKFYLLSFIAVISVSMVNSFQYFYPDLISWSQVNKSFSGEVVRVGGLFRSELISGSFLIYFLPFALIFINMSKYSYLEIFLLIFTFFGILFSGERSAFLSFMIFCMLYLLKDIKQNSIFIIIVLLSLSIVFYFNFYIFKRYTIDLYTSMTNIHDSSYIGLFFSALKLSLIDMKTFFIGNGADTFSNVCDKNYNLFKDEIYICNVHPHNFYLEVLYSFGILPIIFLLFFYFKTLIYYFLNFKNLSNRLFIFYTSVIVFFMPLKTSNSIFQQRFGFIFFLYLIIFIYLNFLKKNKLR